MDKLLALLLFITAVGVAVIAQPAGPLAVLFGSLCAVIAVFCINKFFKDEERFFLRRLFIAALLLRVGLATATYIFGLQEFFGGDSLTYDNAGYALYNSWFGYYDQISEYYLQFATRGSGSGFGMAYVVATVYTLIGRNPLAIQLLNCVLGAATAILIYVGAKNIFKNSRVARYSAIFVGVFPSLIIWSSQGLKDGIICFLLALAINLLFSLHKGLNYGNIVLLLGALIGIYTLRFYIFFAFVVAVLGSFFLGAQKSAASIGKQIAILIVITLGLTYLGVLRSAQENLDRFGNLETLQNSRLDQARSAESGFGEDIDVSTPTGAIQAIPIGLVYLLLAPFPWQISNFRQLITLPEVLVWWLFIPFMIYGIWYTLKNKLRESIAIILLTSLLTVSYAIFQGNVGTAYRMRAQMQIFYFIFIAVGLVIWQEKRENRRLILHNQNRRR
jgi:4-amino-4-deoxy-L-arabinose transferase-like glycosyltransferase